MASLQEVETAFMRAHQAGDTSAATVLAREVARLRASTGPDPTEGQSFGQNALQATGQGMASIIRAVGGGPILERMGLPSTKEEADRLDAPLLRTAGGKVGSVLGKAALTAPAAFIPGSNTYLGATIIGGGLGAATTEGGLKDRALGAAGGAAGGAVGKAAGDLLGAGVQRLAQYRTDRTAAQQVANAQRAGAVRTAQDAGYALPPTEVKPTFVNEALEGLSGKIKTAQAASTKNQAVTNTLARKELGLPDDAPLNLDTLDAIRAEAGHAYGAITQLGKFDAAGAKLPASVKVDRYTDPLTLAKRQTVDAGELVAAWKQANHDANAYFRAYARDANPETQAKARAAAAAAKQIDGFLAKQLDDLGLKDMSQALKDARVRIAKTYTVEKALNPQTGDVSAPALAKELQKGKALSGGLRTAAEVSQAFPKATQALKESYKAVSPLDYATAAISGTATGNPLMLGTVLARPAARSVILSPQYQRMLGGNDYSTGLLQDTLLPLLGSEGVRRGLPVAGGLLGSPALQQ